MSFLTFGNTENNDQPIVRYPSLSGLASEKNDIIEYYSQVPITSMLTAKSCKGLWGKKIPRDTCEKVTSEVTEVNSLGSTSEG